MVNFFLSLRQIGLQSLVLIFQSLVFIPEGFIFLEKRQQSGNKREQFLLTLFTTYNALPGLSGQGLNERHPPHQQ